MLQLQTHLTDANLSTVDDSSIREASANDGHLDPPHLFNNNQISQIKSIVTGTVQETMQTIASNTARAAVKAMRNVQVQDNTHSQASAISKTPRDLEFPAFQGTPLLLDANNNLYGNPFQDVPASYVKEIQSGEFF